MNYDDVLPFLSRGDFGKYQKKIYFLLCLPTILCAFHKLAGVFLLALPDHRCRLDGELSNTTFDLSGDVWNSSFPFDTVKNEFSKCEHFRNSSSGVMEVVKCSEYVWDTSKVESSAVKSFMLICDRGKWRASADSLMMTGVLVGSYVFGDLSDKFGRKKAFMLALLIQVVFGLIAAISPEFITYTICRMIVGATTSGVVLVSYCLSLEMVGKESRLYAGTIVMMFFSGGYMLIGVLAHFIHDWRWLQAVITIPGALFLLYWWIIPESTRWLLGNNQKDKAIRQILKVAKANKLVVPPEVLDKLEAEKIVDAGSKKPSLLDLFKSPNLRNKSLIIFFDWFIISGTYYGLSWSTNSLGGNEILNFVISGGVEFPACYFLILTLNRWGRKKILAGSMVVGGACLLLSLMVPDGHTWLVVGLTMLGKMSITASYGTVYIFSSEQFPTVIRNVALGAASMSARIGGIAAPYLIYLSQFWKPAPFLMFGVTACAGGLLSMLLPETYNKELPETLADGERLGKDVEASQPVEMRALNQSKE